MFEKKKFNGLKRRNNSTENTPNVSVTQTLTVWIVCATFRLFKPGCDRIKSIGYSRDHEGIQLIENDNLKPIP